MYELRRDLTIVIVTHNLQQAARVSDVTAFFYLGQPHRIGPDRPDVHEPQERAHRGVHHGEVRMTTTVEPNATGFRHFHDQLAQLKQRLLDMSDLATSLLDLSVDALLSRDASLADAVLTTDRDVDALELEIEDQAIGLLALQQPMARDLRFIIASIKVANDLERVGDHAVNIAQSALRLASNSTLITPDPEIAEMSRRARQMLRDALTAFVRADGALGRDVCRADDEVDAMHNSVFRILVTHMMEDARTITPSLELLLVSRNLERVADLATNIGEDAVFLAEGKTIKHHAETHPAQPIRAKG